MRFLVGLILLGGVACAPAPEPEPEPELKVLTSYRSFDAQIASQVNVTADRMAGDWFVRERFAQQPGPVSGMELDVLPGGALQWSYENGDCIEDVCFSTENLVLLEPRGQGRWRPVGEDLGGFDVELWVLWMDFDDRTMAIGTPDGRFGLIFDKSATGGADRITAARDIMEWFGYEVSRLEKVER